MPEFSSSWQWLGWFAIATVALLIIDNMFANVCKAWAARKK